MLSKLLVQRFLINFQTAIVIFISRSLAQFRRLIFGHLLLGTQGVRSSRQVATYTILILLTLFFSRIGSRVLWDAHC